MRTTRFYVCMVVLLLKCIVSKGERWSWQLCVDTCYFMSHAQITYRDLPSICNWKYAGKPANFGSKPNEVIKTMLASCFIGQLENSSYWINNNTNGDCRTATFSRNNVSIDPNVSCTSLKHPICETNKSLCHPPANNTLKFDEWIDLGINDTSYIVTKNSITYCEAKQLCETTWLGKMVNTNKDRLEYSSMTLLGSKLGLKGAVHLEVWLHSSGVTCKQNNGSGNAMIYTGPYVIGIQIRDAHSHIRMLCERKTSSFLSSTSSLSSSTSLTLSKTTAQWQSPSLPVAQQVKSLQYITQLQSGLQLTTQRFSPSESTAQRKPQRQPSLPLTTQWQSSQESKATLAVSKISGEPIWLKSSKNDYFINYNSSIYKQNVSINYIRIFPNPVSKTSSFWIGANIDACEELNKMDVDLIPFENEPVRFKITKEEVQSIWQQLRQGRYPSP